MSRWKASGIHLGISTLIAVLALGVLYLLWYPSPYFSAMGADHLILILIGVDIVIGPLITLIIYKAGKKGLKFDLAVIAFLQSAALAYGVVTMAEARPVFTVFTGPRFEVVSASALDPAEVAQAPRVEFRSLSWTGPRLIGAKMPANPADADRVVFAALQGKDLQQFPQFYLPYADVAEDAGRRAKPIPELKELNPGKAATIDSFLKERGVSESDAGFLPLKARRSERTVVLRRNGEILGILELNPW